MMMVSSPQPTPKISCPVFVIGDVTMSVAIKQAPSMMPPVSIVVKGSIKAPLSHSHSIPLNTNAVPINDTGMCQLITLRHSR